MNHLHSARRRNELFYCARGSANAHPAALRRARHPRGSFGQIQHFERCMKIWNGDLHEKKRSTAAALRCARQPVAGPDPHALMARSAAAPVCAGPRITVISNLNDVLTAALRSVLLHYPAKIFLLFPNSGPAITASQHRERRKKFQTKTAFGLISVQVSLFASTPATKMNGVKLSAGLCTLLSSPSTQAQCRKNVSSTNFKQVRNAKNICLIFSGLDTLTAGHFSAHSVMRFAAFGQRRRGGGRGLAYN